MAPPPVQRGNGTAISRSMRTWPATRVIGSVCVCHWMRWPLWVVYVGKCVRHHWLRARLALHARLTARNDGCG
eukprot:5569363-Alexandrium_andersonii.AAC.1